MNLLGYFPSSARQRSGASGWSYQRSIVLAVLSVVYAMVSSEADYSVVIPVIILINGVALFLSVLSMPENEAPVFDIGAIFALVIGIYGSFPIFQYQLRHGIYGVASDSRLYFSPPTVSEIAAIGWFHVTFFFAFAAIYLLVKRGEKFEPALGNRITPNQILVAVSAVVMATLFKLGVDIAYDLPSSPYSASAKGAYSATMVTTQVLPQFLRQIYLHLGGVVLTFKLVLAAAILLQRNDPLRLLLPWLGFEMLIASLHLGERMPIVLLIGGGLLFYSCYRRRIGILPLVLMGSAVFFGFIVFGVMRSWGLDDSSSAYDWWEYSNEMEGLFANSLHFQQLRALNIIDLPIEVQLSELTAFVPQQFLPFGKMDYGSWYSEFAFDNAWSAAFGVIPQAFAGFGWPELVARGLLTGGLFGFVHRYFCGRSQNWLYTVAYAWFVLHAYQSFRMTTLQPVVLFFLEAMPVLLTIHLVGRWKPR